MAGKPNVLEAITEYQFIGIKTPVYLEIRLIPIKEIMPATAFIDIVLSKLFDLMAKIKIIKKNVLSIAI